MLALNRNLSYYENHRLKTYGAPIGSTPMVMVKDERFVTAINWKLLCINPKYILAMFVGIVLGHIYLNPLVKSCWPEDIGSNRPKRKVRNERFVTMT